MKTCEKCGSPFYGKHHRCKGTPLFKTREELGLKENELPFKYRVEIDPEEDGQVEVSRKRALLRLNSQRVYMQAGCSVQALNGMKSTALWMARLAENMDEEDKKSVLHLLIATEGMLAGLEDLTNRMENQAVQMEEVVEKERKHARLVRVRLTKITFDKSKKTNEFGIFRGQDNGFGVYPLESEVPLTLFDFAPRAETGS